MKLDWGSPPRGRGRRNLPKRLHHPEGLTPARAGTARCARLELDTGGAHPRAGGDGIYRGPADSRAWGSPPRGRGRRRLRPLRRPVGGLTPARAGTAESRLMRRVILAGSPPRGRGRHRQAVGRGPLAGLTPARAGTATAARRHGGRWWAHPRAGGDGQGVSLAEAQGMGSPPRGRGRPEGRIGNEPTSGLTPARAGTAVSVNPTYTLHRAHPRAGGDGSVIRTAAGMQAGSPPRGRGRHLDPEGRGPRPGLTPARAGTATGGWTAGPATWAHPRAGGDGAAATGPRIVGGGSPPRGRGRLRRLSSR